MNRRRIISLVLLVVVTGGLAYWLNRGGADRARIRIRYDAMMAALCASDTNAVVLLFAPSHRTRATNELWRVSNFALPLDHRSGIRVNGAHAMICPRREFPLIPLLSIGHEVEMIKVEGEWYFTGRISIW